MYRIRLKLPEEVTCKNCVLQWHYTAGNNWGLCSNGENKPGCGAQENFRSCSDIAIFAPDDSEYFQFKNLSRVSGDNNLYKFDNVTGLYNIIGEGVDHGRSHNNIESRAGSNNDELDNSNESLNECDGDCKSPMEGEKIYDTRGKVWPKTSKTPNDKRKRTKTKSTRNKKLFIEERKRGKADLYDGTDEDLRSPNYFTEDGEFPDRTMNNYVFSSTFRKPSGQFESITAEQKVSNSSRNFRRQLQKDVDIQSNESFSDERGSIKLIYPSKSRQFLNEDEKVGSYPSRPDNNKKISNLLTSPTSLSSQTTDGTAGKFAEVLSLLLNLTSSSSSPTEANVILERIAKSLSLAVQVKSIESQVKQMKISNEGKRTNDSPIITAESNSDSQIIHYTSTQPSITDNTFSSRHRPHSLKLMARNRENERKKLKPRDNYRDTPTAPELSPDLIQSILKFMSRKSQN